VVDDVPDPEFDARFRALDPEKLRQEYGGDAIRFNGPRRFLGDRFTAVAFDGGEQSMLGPIPMYLYGTFVVPDFDAFISGKQVPYHETVSRRTTTWFFDAGTEVYELVSPEGTVFVMQSASLMVDPQKPSTSCRRSEIACRCRRAGTSGSGRWRRTLSCQSRTATTRRTPSSSTSSRTTTSASAACRLRIHQAQGETR
jgi:hypothetical protein